MTGEASREMTLAEWVDQLHIKHGARAELRALLAERDAPQQRVTELNDVIASYVGSTQKLQAENATLRERWAKLEAWVRTDCRKMIPASDIRGEMHALTLAPDEPRATDTYQADVPIGPVSPPERS